MSDAEGAAQQLNEVGARVLAEIQGYSYEYVEGLIGNHWSRDKVDAELQAMRAALVTPYWADVRRRDTIEQDKMAALPIVRCGR